MPTEERVITCKDGRCKQQIFIVANLSTSTTSASASLLTLSTPTPIPRSIASKMATFNSSTDSVRTSPLTIIPTTTPKTSLILEPTKVNPPLSNTSSQSTKGSTTTSPIILSSTTLGATPSESSRLSQSAAVPSQQSASTINKPPQPTAILLPEQGRIDSPPGSVVPVVPPPLVGQAQNTVKIQDVEPTAPVSVSTGRPSSASKPAEAVITSRSTIRTEILNPQATGAPPQQSTPGGGPATLLIATGPSPSPSPSPSLETSGVIGLVPGTNGSPRETIASAQPISTPIGSPGGVPSVGDGGHELHSSPSQSQAPTGAIVGGAIGGVAALALISILFWLYRRRLLKKQVSQPLSPMGDGPSSGGYQNGQVRREMQTRGSAAAFTLPPLGQLSRPRGHMRGTSQPGQSRSGSSELSHDWFGHRKSQSIHGQPDENPFSDANAVNSKAATQQPPLRGILKPAPAVTAPAVPPRSGARSLIGQQRVPPKAPSIIIPPPPLSTTSSVSSATFGPQRAKFHSNPFDLEIDPALLSARPLPSHRASSIYPEEASAKDRSGVLADGGQGVQSEDEYEDLILPADINNEGQNGWESPMGLTASSVAWPPSGVGQAI